MLNLIKTFQSQASDRHYACKRKDLPHVSISSDFPSPPTVRCRDIGIRAGQFEAISGPIVWSSCVQQIRSKQSLYTIEIRIVDAS